MLLVVVGCHDYYAPCPTHGCGDWRLHSPPRSPSELIQTLAQSYQTRNYDRFSNLFSTVADGAPYFFTFGDSAGGQWNLLQELCFHRRMFKPEDPLPGETPVPQELWLVSIDIQFAPVNAWTERPDLYRSPSNPNGLDPERWRAMDAQYTTNVLYTMQGTTSFQTNCRANFVVIEDLAKGLGSDRKFLLYRWEDLGGGSRARRLYACPSASAGTITSAAKRSNRGAPAGAGQ
jgi:hypothetical protein